MSYGDAQPANADADERRPLRWRRAASPQPSAPAAAGPAVRTAASAAAVRRLSRSSSSRRLLIAASFASASRRSRLADSSTALSLAAIADTSDTSDGCSGALRVLKVRLSHADFRMACSTLHASQCMAACSEIVRYMLHATRCMPRTPRRRSLAQTIGWTTGLSRAPTAAQERRCRCRCRCHPRAAGLQKPSACSNGVAMGWWRWGVRVRARLVSACGPAGCTRANVRRQGY